MVALRDAAIPLLIDQSLKLELETRVQQQRPGSWRSLSLVYLTCFLEIESAIWVPHVRALPARVGGPKTGRNKEWVRKCIV